MGFCLFYRSHEPMHPALAFEISEDADRLIEQYHWCDCEPVSLRQPTDGFLAGQSRSLGVHEDIPVDPDAGLQNGSMLIVVEILCRLSANHRVDWEIGHDYDPLPIGHIIEGIADEELLEEIETLESLADLLDDDDLDRDDIHWPGVHEDQDVDADSSPSMDQETEDEGPRLLKFPGTK